MGDDDLVYQDADGSLSSYYNIRLSGFCANGGQGYPLTDPTWTAFSLGGPLNGQAPTKANILAIEDGFIYAVGPPGDNTLHFYSYAFGTYGGSANGLFTTFTDLGGPLNGVGLRDAVTNQVPNITFLGRAALELVFFDASTNTILTFNHNSLFRTFAGTTATSFSDPVPADAFIYDQTATSAVLGPDFLGVGDLEAGFLDATGHMEWYNVFLTNGPGVFESDMSYLRGPQSRMKWSF